MQVQTSSVDKNMHLPYLSGPLVKLWLQWTAAKWSIISLKSTFATHSMDYVANPLRQLSLDQTAPEVIQNSLQFFKGSNNVGNSSPLIAHLKAGLKWDA